MHPAYSIIWFTTLSGMGYGLAAALGLGAVPVEGLTAVTAYGLALALIGGGLLFSTAHLGHPERALLAFSQWRSSWLSREGVLAIATFVPLSACALWAAFDAPPPTWAGLILALLCVVTVYATSMIYASLRAIHQWNSWLTSACYLVFSASSGFLALLAITGPSQNSGKTTIAAMALVGLGWVFKALWWRRADTTASSSTAHTALGLPEGSKIRRFESPHTGTNYLMREMGHRIGRKHGKKLRIIAIALGLIAPLVFLSAAGIFSDITAYVFLILAASAHYCGIVVERWLFFAQARHTVMLYYDAGHAPC